MAKNSRRLVLFGIALLIGVLAAACATEEPTATVTEPEAPEAETPEPEAPEPEAPEPEAPEPEPEAADEIRTYRVGYSSSPGIADLANLLAWDRLRLEGIDIETTFFAGADVVIQALERGDLDFATNIGGPAAMGAIQEGLPLKIFYGYIGQEWVVAGTTDIQEPAELEGKRLAIHSHGGLSDVFVRAIIDIYDLQDVDVVVIPTSSARAEAIAQGQIDAAPLQLDDAIVLENRDPENFHTILVLDEEVDASTGVTIAGESWLNENPEDVQRIVTVLIETYRRINCEPDWASEQAVRFLGGHFDPEILDQIVRQYVDLELWDPDGGLDRDEQRAGVEFNAQYEIIPPEAVDQFEDFYDFRFVETALEELGPHTC